MTLLTLIRRVGGVRIVRLLLLNKKISRWMNKSLLWENAVVTKAITQSVDAAIHACDGYFLFDMIHLKKKNQWKYVKEGIDNYLKTIEK